MPAPSHRRRAARAFLIAPLLVLAACVSATPPGGEGGEAGADAYPDLSAIPTPQARPDARALAGEEADLRREAEALRALLAEAGTPRDTDALVARGEALRAEIARARAALADAPPITVPDDMRPNR